uniref:RING-type domain-containing protein n=1 Tax=Sinocyclocheilus rhinocerous TaxID=307959 RepID=A0A673HCL1_9TELE
MCHYIINISPKSSSNTKLTNECFFPIITATVHASHLGFHELAGARVFQDEFMCSVCLDLLKDPVTIQCGHSYCKSCITDCWDQEDQMRVYSCPQCRQTFSPRPALARNTMLFTAFTLHTTAEMNSSCKKSFTVC